MLPLSAVFASARPGIHATHGTPGAARSPRAFTLVEMLVVIAIIALVIATVVPSIQSVANLSFAGSVSNISSLLEQARAYAMAYNTYVYVGFFEADASQSAGTVAQQAGHGRIYVAIAQCKDGTSGYSTGLWTKTNLVSVGRLQRFDGLHLVPASQLRGQLPKMDANSSGLDLDLSVATAAPTATTFKGSDLGIPPGVSTVLFSQVIQYTPSGSPNVITSLAASPTIPPYLQMAFVPTHGAIVPAVTTNCAGLQLDGLTGAVSEFQP